MGLGLKYQVKRVVVVVELQPVSQLKSVNTPHQHLMDLRYIKVKNGVRVKFHRSTINVRLRKLKLHWQKKLVLLSQELEQVQVNLDMDRLLVRFKNKDVQ